jgi:hypothetical protein
MFLFALFCNFFHQWQIHSISVEDLLDGDDLQPIEGLEHFRVLNVLASLAIPRLLPLEQYRRVKLNVH